jgi:hypothetical protein
VTQGARLSITLKRSTSADLLMDPAAVMSTVFAVCLERQTQKAGRYAKF